MSERPTSSALFKNFEPELRRVIARQLGRKLRADVSVSDIVQMAFKSFFVYIEKEKCRNCQSQDFWRILVRIAINKIRDVGVVVHGPIGPLPTEVQDAAPPPELAIELAEAIEWALKGFSERDREMVGMVLEDYKVIEIADKTGWSRHTVRRVLNRFGDRLKRSLHDSSHRFSTSDSD